MQSIQLDGFSQAPHWKSASVMGSIWNQPQWYLFWVSFQCSRCFTVYCLTIAAYIRDYFMIIKLFVAQKYECHRVCKLFYCLLVPANDMGTTLMEQYQCTKCIYPSSQNFHDPPCGHLHKCEKWFAERIKKMHYVLWLLRSPAHLMLSAQTPSCCWQV